MGDRQAPASLVLVQELANTLDVDSGTDRLDTADDLARFVRAHELTAFRLGTRDLAGLRELREALRAACLAHTGSPASPEAVTALDRQLSEAPLTLRLDGDGEVALGPAHGLSGLPAFTAHLAVRIATAAGDGTWARLKACEAHDCQWVYYDRSPAGRSRWCTMAVCGSRAKMRTYRARRTR